MSRWHRDNPEEYTESLAAGNAQAYALTYSELLRIAESDLLLTNEKDGQSLNNPK